MRVAGVPIADITDRLGYATRAATRAALTRASRRHLKHTRAELEEIRDLELARLDELQTAWWPEATERMNPQAVDRVLKIMQHRAALIGLEPKAAQVSQGDTVTTNVLVIGGDADRGEMADKLREAAAQIGVGQRNPEPDLDSDAAVIDIDAQ